MERDRSVHTQLVDVSYNGLANYRLTRQAEELTRRVPWMFDQILEMLQQHREEWQQRVDDMEKVAHSPMDKDQVAKIGLRSAWQILASGELLRARIAAIVNQAIVTQEGKPISTQWSPEQTKVGHHKRQLLSTALTFTHGL